MNQRFKRACWLYIEDSPNSANYPEYNNNNNNNNNNKELSPTTNQTL